jgi:hypothetical protein
METAMTTLTNMITALQKLQLAGHGQKQVFYRRGSSGDCGELGSAFVSTEVNECGPFDLEPGEEYIVIYAGN